MANGGVQVALGALGFSNVLAQSAEWRRQIRNSRQGAEEELGNRRQPASARPQRVTELRARLPGACHRRGAGSAEAWQGKNQRRTPLKEQEHVGLRGWRGQQPRQAASRSRARLPDLRPSGRHQHRHGALARQEAASAQARPRTSRWAGS